MDMDQENRSEHQYKTFEEFWPFYVGQHRLPQTRQWHFFGTSVFLTFVFVAVFYKMFFPLVFGIVTAYAFAWIGHFFCEHNQPATFKYPFFSLLGDFKMFYLMLTGRMDHEVRQISPRRDPDVE